MSSLGYTKRIKVLNKTITHYRFTYIRITNVFFYLINILFLAFLKVLQHNWHKFSEVGKYTTIVGVRVQVEHSTPIWVSIP